MLADELHFNITSFYVLLLNRRQILADVLHFKITSFHVLLLNRRARIGRCTAFQHYIILRIASRRQILADELHFKITSFYVLLLRVPILHIEIMIMILQN